MTLLNILGWFGWDFSGFFFKLSCIAFNIIQSQWIYCWEYVFNGEGGQLLWFFTIKCLFRIQTRIKWFKSLVHFKLFILWTWTIDSLIFIFLKNFPNKRNWFFSEKKNGSVSLVLEISILNIFKIDLILKCVWNNYICIKMYSFITLIVIIIIFHLLMTKRNKSRIQL